MNNNNIDPSGTIYLIPSELGPESNTLGQYVKDVIYALDHFAVENERSARRFLRKCGYSKDFDDVTLRLLNKDTLPEEIASIISIVEKGLDLGILSEAGCPAIADPGSDLVALAHRKGIRVLPLVGPSSILLALMGSGLGGQSFAFHGYLPIDKHERARSILELERLTRVNGQTQIFMETPYRNDKLIAEVLNRCHQDTLFTIAARLTQPGEWIRTKTIAQWKKAIPAIHKQPAIFLLGIQSA